MSPSVAANWMNRGKRCRRETIVDRLSFVSKEMQESLKESLQHQLPELEDLMPEHQKVQKKDAKKKNKASRTKAEIYRKRAGRQEKKSGKLEKNLSGSKVDQNRMADAEMEAELQGLQAGEERRGSNSSQAVDSCLETMVELVFVFRPDQAKSTFDALCKIFVGKFESSISSAQMQGREEGRID